MVNLGADVVAALRSSANVAGRCGDRIYFAYPPTKPVYPLVVYRETNNRTAYIADGAEVMAEVGITVSVMSDKASDINPLAIAVDYALRSIGFVREGAVDMYDDGVYVKTLRYLTNKEVDN